MKNQLRTLAAGALSRRNFARFSALAGAGMQAGFFNEALLAQFQRPVDPPPAGSVMIDNNENPMGPCAEAREACRKVVDDGGRYLIHLEERMVRLFASQEGLKPASVAIFAGSSPALHQAVLAFTSPTRPYVAADPSYESGSRAAQFIGSKVIRVPLAKDYSHDVRAMAAASPDAGLIYICNPNNPTGTVTRPSDIEWLVANKPRGSVIMIDEAYMHISPGAAFSSAMAAADKDVIILRTFSKIYGMAGLRAGAAFARPDLLEKLSGHSSTGFQSVTAMAAALASLESKTVVPERRKAIGEIRDDVSSFLTKNNFSFVPSVSNCIMIDVKKPGNTVVTAMRKEGVFIGRVWPIWPTHVRITVGTRDEMEKFKTAFLKVMA